MRHLVSNLAITSLALLIALGSVIFAWARSSQVIVVTEDELLAHYARVDDRRFRWEGLGAHSYARNCANCHLPGGRGWDEYPPVTAAGELLSSSEGRTYLVDLHLYGLDGPASAVPMPRMEHLADAELAAVINYVAFELGDPGGETRAEALSPGDVAARRGLRIAPGDVAARRPDL